MFLFEFFTFGQVERDASVSVGRDTKVMEFKKVNLATLMVAMTLFTSQCQKLTQGSQTQLSVFLSFHFF